MDEVHTNEAANRSDVREGERTSRLFAGKATSLNKDESNRLANLESHVFGWPSLAWLNLMNVLLIAFLMVTHGCQQAKMSARIQALEQKEAK